MVHLNSGTKIKYPIKFLKGQKREVFIDGEAYFKVFEDKEHPFVVNADEMAIQVLGTEFNVSSYAEDNEIKTVLVEGSVRLSSALDPGKHTILEPGFKGSWDRTDHQTNVEKVNIELYTGWIDGEMIFRKSSFANMVKKLERRYNVTIVNNYNELGEKTFNATFSVNVETIDDIMQSISEIYPLEYAIDNRKITISNPKTK